MGREAKPTRHEKSWQTGRTASAPPHGCPVPPRSRQLPSRSRPGVDSRICVGCRHARTVCWYVCSTPAATLRHLQKSPRARAATGDVCGGRCSCENVHRQLPALSYVQPAPHLVLRGMAHPAAPSPSPPESSDGTCGACVQVRLWLRPQRNAGVSSLSLHQGQLVPHMMALTAIQPEIDSWKRGEFLAEHLPSEDRMSR